MATIDKHGTGWRARVRRGGVSKTESFRTKTEATAWAAQLEADIAAGRRGNIPDHSFRELIERYEREVTPTKRGARPESLRLKRTMDDDLAKIRLPDLDATHIAAWRDRRMGKVGTASTRREWCTLSHACNVAIREWRWLDKNPFSMVTKPPPPKARKRRPKEGEVDRILHCLGYNREGPIVTKSAAVGAAALFAIETAMRQGEIASLDRANIKGRVAHLTKTKNGDERDVPLSKAALEILARLPERGDETAPVFGLKATHIDALWRKAKGRGEVVGLTFHDLRREATTRLAKKLDVMTLAKVTGHRDLRILQAVYYAPTMEDVAGLLD